jgi:hypothetical protein
MVSSASLMKLRWRQAPTSFSRFQKPSTNATISSWRCPKPTSPARFAPTEWAAVLAGDPRNERGRLLPLLLEECELPTLLKSLNHVDVSSNEKFEQSYGRIWQHLSRTEPNDIEQRSREIDDLIDQNRQDQAWKRLLDFARDFAKRETLNKLIAITWELERLDKENDISKRSMARVELLTEGLNVRENIINTLSLRVAQ